MIDQELSIEYRGYVFVNRALSSIQKGIQGSHATTELFNRWLLTGTPKSGASAEIANTLTQWAKSHKTLVFVDCGFHQEILEHYSTAVSFCENFGLPHALFMEDDWTMNSMATSFAIIVPSTIYDINLDEYYEATKCYTPILNTVPLEIEFCQYLRGFKLAV